VKYQRFFTLASKAQGRGHVNGLLNRTSFSGSCFSEEDCRKLDKKVRGGHSGFDELTAVQLRELRSHLDKVAAGFCRAEGWSKHSTPLQQLSRAERIAKASQRLLSELSADVTSNPDEYDLDLIERHGIFERGAWHIPKLIAAVQVIAECANSTAHEIEKLMRSDDPPRDRGRTFDRRKIWVYSELAKIYKRYWGKGTVPVSRSNGEGGPSVRYFQFTIKKIVGREPTMDSVHDHLRTCVDRGDSSQILF